MNEDEDEFEGFDGDEDGVLAEPAPDTLTVRASRSRRSWRDIERLREQRELERLGNQDNWFDDLDHAS